MCPDNEAELARAGTFMAVCVLLSARMSDEHILRVAGDALFLALRKASTTTWRFSALCAPRTVVNISFRISGVRSLPMDAVETGEVARAPTETDGDSGRERPNRFEAGVARPSHGGVLVALPKTRSGVSALRVRKSVPLETSEMLRALPLRFGFRWTERILCTDAKCRPFPRTQTAN